MNAEGTVPMWKVGYDTETWPDQADPLVVLRTFRHGNFDYVRNAVLWDDKTANHQLPPSLYLKAKPAFFGNNPWPWVESTASTEAQRLGTLPAKVRFDSIHGSATR